MTKRFLSALTAIVITLALSLGATACLTQTNAKALVFSSAAEDVLALSALSSAELLAACKEESLQSLLSSNGEGQTRPQEINREDADEIASYISAFDSLIRNDGLSVTVKENKPLDGEKSDYKLVMTINVPNGQPVDVYYNKGETVTETDGDETETTTAFCGAIYKDGVEYIVEGEKEIETEGDEKEESLKITTKTKDNPLDYVVITRSLETEPDESEISYEYEVYSNGLKVIEKELSFKQEKDGIKLSFEAKDAAQGLKKEYEITTQGNEFKVEYKLGKQKGVLTVKESENGYLFAYANGFTETIKF